jgi:hypothetical protein
MARAILEGRKTMTRRVIKPQDGIPTVNEEGYIGVKKYGAGVRGMDIFYPCMYQSGDILWVRETTQAWGYWEGIQLAKYVQHFRNLTSEKHPYLYAGEFVKSPTSRSVLGYWKRPSIFMPREAARIFLKVTDVRVERVQDISEEDAFKEGAENFELMNLKQIPVRLYCDYGRAFPIRTFKAGFYKIWEELNAKRGYGWDANPLVWVIEFKRVEV